MQMIKDLAFGKEISTQSVSIFDASISHLRLQFMDFRQYSIMPSPALICVSDLSFRMRLKSSSLSCSSETELVKKVSHIPKISGH